MVSRILMISLTVVFLFCVNAAAETIDGRCAIRFYAESTLHDFEGQVACQPFPLQGEKGDNDHEIIRSSAVTVLVKGIDTDNSSRDEKMYTMFDSENFPVIKGLFSELDPEGVLQQLKESDQGSGFLEFNLQIRDVTQKVRAETRELKVTPEKITFVMEFFLSLSSYELEPPSVLGMIRVADQLRVETHVILTRRASNQN